MYRNRCLLAALLSLLLIALVGCGSKAAPDVESSVAMPVTSELTSALVTGASDLVVRTPVGELAFPNELSNQVKIEEASSESYHLVRFYAEAAGNPVLLFELAFGGDQGDYAVGTAPDTSGRQTPIWLNVKALERGSDWTDEETEQMNLLQSCVNDLLEQIYALPGFVKGE